MVTRELYHDRAAFDLIYATLENLICDGVRKVTSTRKVIQ